MSWAAKSFVFDVATNWGDENSMGITSIDFMLNNNKLQLIEERPTTTYDSPLLTPPELGFLSFSSTNTDQSEKIFKITYSKTGLAANIAWEGTENNNQRIIVTFLEEYFSDIGNTQFYAMTASKQNIDSIIINNYHDNGANTNKGIKDVKIYITDNYFASKEFGEDLEYMTKIFDGEITQHTLSNTIDNFEIIYGSSGEEPIIPQEDGMSTIIPPGPSSINLELKITPNYTPESASTLSITTTDYVPTGTYGNHLANLIENFPLFYNSLLENSAAELHIDWTPLYNANQASGNLNILSTNGMLNTLYYNATNNKLIATDGINSTSIDLTCVALNTYKIKLFWGNGLDYDIPYMQIGYDDQFGNVTPYSGFPIGNNFYFSLNNEYHHYLKNFKVIQPNKDNIPITWNELPKLNSDISITRESNTKATVIITCPDNFKITTDGSEPFINDIEYITPFIISESTIIKVKAFASGFKPSTISELAFLAEPLIPSPDGTNWDVDEQGNYIYDEQGNYTYSTAMPTDLFNTGSLDTEMWTIEDPIGDGTVSMTETELSLSIPSGTAHDVYTSGNDALMITTSLQNEDFSFIVKFNSTVNERYQLQGIVIQHDSDNYLRLDYFSDGSFLRIYSAWLYGSNISQKANISISLRDAPLYMKITRTGDSWTQEYSTNGIDYATATTFNQTFVVTKLGLYSGNAGSSPPAHTCLIDYIQFE